MIDHILQLRDQVKVKAPLIHCLTNHISINDCANVILAVGAKPIMAEQRVEAAEITADADALFLNLGNITDERMASMLLSAEVAASRGIPTVLDLVGVGCSRLRLDFAQELILRFRPGIIKGNRAEITALSRQKAVSRGVDASAADLVTDPAELAQTARALSATLECVILISGPVDIIALDGACWACHNGHTMLGEITGTGCMLGALTASFASVGDPLDGTLLAAILEGIAGELAANAARGIGSFKMEFFDCLYNISDQQLRKLAQMERMTGSYIRRLP